MRVSCILCDIEGTTTSITFVHEVLFPLAYRRMQDYVVSRWGSQELESLRSEITPFTPGAVAETLRGWITADRKHTMLKSIQGKIWKQSYEAGEIQSHIYPDVLPKFAEWNAKNILIAIFSSGSVEAQQLLFRYTQAGDLTRYISEYFDTTIGRKQDSSSYARITEALKVPASKILFLSDTIAELDAAREAGVKTTQLLREDTYTSAGSNHLTARSFQDLA